MLYTVARRSTGSALGRTDIISNSGGSKEVEEGRMKLGGVGIGPFECFCCNKSQVSGVLGATPDELRV